MYCKSLSLKVKLSFNICINSSKVYCKCRWYSLCIFVYVKVLIVAKCIVNEEGKILTVEDIEY